MVIWDMSVMRLSILVVFVRKEDIFFEEIMNKFVEKDIMVVWSLLFYIRFYT